MSSAHPPGLSGAEGQVDWWGPVGIVGWCVPVCPVRLSERDSEVYLLFIFGACVWFACRRKLGLHWGSQTIANSLSFVSRLGGPRGKKVVLRIQKGKLKAFP